MARQAPSTTARLKRAIARVAAILALALLSYLAAALLGGLIPVNASWREPTHGVRVLVRTNGVHTDLIVPAVAAGVDWRALLRPEHLPDPRYAGTHYGIGWGSRDFYLNTPTWADLTPGIALRALVGNTALMHVYHEWNPAPGPGQRAVHLRPAEYRQLARFIAASFAAPTPIRGYGRDDLFYPAHGRYTPLQTSNNWTADALAHAGVRVGAWTPFAWGVMRWFDAPDLKPARARP